MSKDHETAGRAYHKADKALSEVDEIRRSLQRKDLFLGMAGIFIVIIGLMSDAFSTVFMLRFQPGFGPIQWLTVAVGVVFFIMAYLK